MELKRILAKDTRTASEQAMEKYGRDVLIISTNRVNGQTELIVAVDVPGTTHTEANHPISSASTPRGKPAVDQATTDDASGMDAFEALLFAQQSTKRSAHIEPPTLQPVPAAPTSARPNEHQLATQADSLRGSEIVALLKDELSALRQEIRLHQQLNLAQPDALAPSLQPLMDELVERGMPPGLREHITEVWKRLDDPIAALGLLESELGRILPPCQPPVQLQGVHVIAGPSGAGKSLTCAKLAHMAADALGSDLVAWISFADHRAGAWSQTQVLAAPSGVATFKAGNSDGLKLLLQELSHMKLVLIDTSGVDFESQIHAVRDVCDHAQVHIVLPVDATLTSIKRALRSDLALNSVVLSKLDESYSPWSMIYGLSQRQAHVAWINASERIHTPMQAYAPQTLAEKALNSLGQLEDDDEETARHLRLHDMHEVPDLTQTLEPFSEPSPNAAAHAREMTSPSPQRHTPLPFGHLRVVN